MGKYRKDGSFVILQIIAGGSIKSMLDNLQPRRVQTMCKEGLIPEVKKFGQSWAIPANAERPADGRIKSGKYIKSKQTNGVQRQICTDDKWIRL